jgi:uncharacterized protein (DUF58 family)
MSSFLLGLYPGPRFLTGLACCIGLLIFFFIAGLPSWTAFIIISFWLSYSAFEVALLFAKDSGIVGHRDLATRFSNGDANVVNIYLQSRYPKPVRIEIIEELPFIFQIRDLSQKAMLGALEHYHWSYTLKPVRRGKYEFGNTLILVQWGLGFWQRKISLNNPVSVAVYPSFLQMSKFELMAFGHHASERGLRKMPKRGVGMEFEQIKKFALGDDIRQINWRATARHGDAMVNHYTEEKSQNIYQCIDKGRLMAFPFDNMYLLDYAINAALMLSNIVLKKGDKAGLLCFDNTVSTHVTASRSRSALHHILEHLYHVDTEFNNADHEKLSLWSLAKLNQRSLIFLYTYFVNFESYKRKEKHLHAIAKKHLLIVIIFKNTGLDRLIQQKSKTMRDLYEQILAEQQWIEQLHIQKRLRSLGIECVLTTPANLGVDSLNKYLELKALGKI